MKISWYILKAWRNNCLWKECYFENIPWCSLFFFQERWLIKQSFFQGFNKHGYQYWWKVKRVLESNFDKDSMFWKVQFNHCNVSLIIKLIIYLLSMINLKLQNPFYINEREDHQPNIMDQLNNQETSDLRIKCNGETFYVHRWVSIRGFFYFYEPI